MPTDHEYRDSNEHIQQNLSIPIRSSRHPVTLVPTEIRGVAMPLPTSGSRTFDLIGDRFLDRPAAGFPVVLSVDETITLELDFRLVKEAKK
jgi:hypothetical protein